MSNFTNTEAGREARPTQRLFTPVQVGPFTLTHRVVMAPLTRSRSEQPGDIPGDLMLEYYTQRASEGGLIISEGTSISIAGREWFGAPGMYSDEQVSGWRRITECKASTVRYLLRVNVFMGFGKALFSAFAENSARVALLTRRCSAPRINQYILYP